MKRILKALFSLSLALTLFLTLGNGTLAGAVEAEAPQGAYSGYLVVLRSAAGDGPLLASDLEEIPEQLIRLTSTDSIYKAPDLDSIRELVYTGRVELAEPDYQVELLEVTSAPNDPYFNQSNYQYNLKRIQVQSAWDAGLSGEGVTVAVIDSGINAAHLDAPVKLGTGRYYYFREPTDKDTDLSKFTFTLHDKDGKLITDEKGEPKLFGYFSSGEVTDTLGHGTAVTGVIAAKSNNGKAIAGIAPNVTILPIRCFTNTPGHLAGYASNMISGLDYAVEQGADIINMSWGLLNNSEAFQRAINSAANAGCILIAAAGNDGNSSIQFPAAYPNVIGVGATDRSGKVANYSQRNGTVHVFAPGSNIYSLGYSNATAISSANGTSFSAPTVAAVAALLMEADPQLTHSEFAQLLVDCSDDISTIDSSAQEYTTAGTLNVRRLLDQVGAVSANITAAPDSLTVQSCFHPSEAMSLTDPNYLILTAAYNSDGHMVESAAFQATRSVYGGYQFVTRFQSTDVALVRSFLLTADGALRACLPPVERSVGQ